VSDRPPLPPRDPSKPSPGPEGRPPRPPRPPARPPEHSKGSNRPLPPARPPEHSKGSNRPLPSDSSQRPSKPPWRSFKLPSFLANPKPTRSRLGQSSKQTRSSGSPKRPSKPRVTGSSSKHNMPEFDWRQATTIIRVWWIKASWKKRIIWLIIGFILFLLLVRLFGGGTSSQQFDGRVTDQGPNASLLQKASNKVLSAEWIRSAEPDLSLDVWYQKKTGQLTISSVEGDTLVAADGKRLKFTGRCWRRAGSTSAPDGLKVVLPLSEPSAVFTDQEQIDGLTYLDYSADRLGTWGPGSGSLILNNKAQPVRFTYALDGSPDDYTFKISYPSSLPVANPERC